MKNQESQSIFKAQKSLKNTKITCIANNSAVNACSNIDCQKYAFVCANQECPCNQQHDECSLVVIKNLAKVLRKKTVSLKPIEQTINIQFDQLIDKVSQIRDSLIAHCQTTFSQYFGLQPEEIQFLQALDNQQVQNLRGKDIFNIEVNLKTLTKKGVYFNSVHEKIKKIIAKIEEDLNQGKNIIQSKMKELIEDRLYYFESAIIKSFEYQTHLLNFFEDRKVKGLNLLFRASEHGFLVNKFHEKCDGKTDTVLVAETEFGKIIGAYTPLAWNSGNQWVVDHSKKSFLFSVSKNVKFSQVDTVNTIFMHQTYGPYFGASPDLYIPNLANQNNCTSALNRTFSNMEMPGNTAKTNLQVLGCENITFKVKDWEVFKVEFE